MKWSKCVSEFGLSSGMSCTWMRLYTILKAMIHLYKVSVLLMDSILLSLNSTECLINIHIKMKYSISLEVILRMFWTALILPFLLMGRQDLERPSQCLVLIGMITWAIKTQWVVLEPLSIQSEVEETLFCKISNNLELFLGLSSIYLEVYRSCKLVQSKDSLFIARFCRFIMRSYLTCSKTKSQAKLSI